MDKKKAIVILLGIVWFMLGAAFFIGFESVEKLLFCVFVFFFCYRYIYAFILNRSIYAPYTGEEISPTEGNLIKRLFMLIIGIGACTYFTFFIP
jgi:TRAP-type mannitol/chloroaromatic compound transport system permease small subunit|tara:strand:- start:682 stop:963 length:282 start_codon:yes stop_codon:yes gene_type:complete